MWVHILNICGRWKGRTALARRDPRHWRNQIEHTLKSNFDQESKGKFAQATKLTPCAPKSAKTWTGTHGEKSWKFGRDRQTSQLSSSCAQKSVETWSCNWEHDIDAQDFSNVESLHDAGKRASRIWLERHSTQQDGANSGAVSVRKVVGLLRSPSPRWQKKKYLRSVRSSSNFARSRPAKRRETWSAHKRASPTTIL